MKDKFIVNDDNVFRIDAGAPDGSTSTLVLGDNNSNLEITIDPFTSVISSIESVYAESIMNENLFLPSYKDNDLEKRYFPSFYCEDEEKLSFVLNYNKDEFVIILSDNLEPASYFEDGRVEYYYNADDVLIFIRVNSLTNEEFEFFEKNYSSKKRLS